MTTITDILQAFGNESVTIIRSNMQRAGQNATGETSASLMSEMVKPNRLQVSGARHIWVLEKGRAPYKGGQPAGLASKLETWMRAKGVQPRANQTIEQASKSLAYLINKYGTKLYRDGGRTDIITPIFEQSRFDELGRKITQVAFDQTVKVIEDNG